MSDEAHDQQPAGILMGIVDPVSGERAVIHLPMIVAADIRRTINEVGIEAVQNIAWLGAMVFQHSLSEQEFHRLRTVVEQTVKSVEQWKGVEEMLLNHSYALLLNKRWTREEAAAYASSVLGTEISTEAWRKRVDRWAEHHNFRPLGQTKRRSRKLSGQTV